MDEDPRVHISIHALREEGDPVSCTARMRTGKFLSTPSARRATGGAKDSTDAVQISIHALREEGDKLPMSGNAPIEWISIHALREEGDSQSSRDGMKKK